MLAFALHEHDLLLELPSSLLLVSYHLAHPGLHGDTLALGLEDVLLFLEVTVLDAQARSCSCSSAEMPMTSPSSATSSPSGGAKPRGGACGSPPELQVRMVYSGVGCSWRCLLLRASSLEASWGCCLRGPCLFSQPGASSSLFRRWMGSPSN
jgi:hypothetical protein